MIPVQPRPEPEGFDARVREPGLAWLDAVRERVHAITEPRAYWREWPECSRALRAAFGRRCAFAAMRISEGHVDHMRSWRWCRDAGQPELTYEWSNLRYVMPAVNSRKGDRVVLDPFEVQPGWFVVALPSLLLRTTDAIPAERRELADRTIRRLGLNRDPVLGLRTEYMFDYRAGEFSLEHLRRCAPLLAEAIAELARADAEALAPELRSYREALRSQRERAGAAFP